MKIKQFFSNPALFFSLLFLLQTLACSNQSTRPNYYKSAADAGPSVVDEKYRLSADRQALEKMREEIPPEKRAENDEIAFTMQLMAEYKRSPTDVRSKFDEALRKKRDKFQKDTQKERDEFTNKERKDREEFLKSLEHERTDFLRLKRKSDERKEFFDQQDEARKTYFQTQRERRDDFESHITEKRKNFEDYAREKRDEFYEQWRSYQKKYDEYQKEKAKEKESPATAPGGTPTPVEKRQDNEVQSFLKEFMEMEQKPSSKLESGQ